VDVSVLYYRQKERKGEKKMLILTIIFYLLDIKEYGIDFVNKNCNFYERVGRWFIMCGWLEVLVMDYILLHI
jgi:hypothetical protein